MNTMDENRQTEIHTQQDSTIWLNLIACKNIHFSVHLLELHMPAPRDRFHYALKEGQFNCMHDFESSAVPHL